LKLVGLDEAADEAAEGPEVAGDPLARLDAELALLGGTLRQLRRGTPSKRSAASYVPVNDGELNGSLQHIYSKRLDRGWCVCRDQDLLDFLLSKGSRHGVVGSPPPFSGKWISIEPGMTAIPFEVCKPANARK
jgi:hypothetical protein